MPLVCAGPAYTSQQCSECRHTGRRNRRSQPVLRDPPAHGRQRVPQHRPQGRDRVDRGA
ncbi:hypothetical protein [Streptomyces sp. NPDC001774]